MQHKLSTDLGGCSLSVPIGECELFMIICENIEKRNFFAWKVQFFETWMKKGHEMCDLLKTKMLPHRQY